MQNKFVAERLDAPKLHSLLQNDNQKNLEWICQREEGYFKLNAVPVKKLNSVFVDSANLSAAIPGITPESSLPADIQNVSHFVTVTITPLGGLKSHKLKTGNFT